MRIVVARDIASAWDDLRILPELTALAADYRVEPTLFRSLIVIFEDSATMSEATGVAAAAGGAMGDAAGMSASTRKLDREEDFNTRYGSYRGWQKAVEVIQPIPRTMARVDLSALVLASGSQDTGAVVDLFARHFFSVPLDSADRAAWTAFLSEQLGTERIERARTYMEDGLRLLLHVMLSSPDYQLD